MTEINPTEIRWVSSQRQAVEAGMLCPPSLSPRLVLNVWPAGDERRNWNTTDLKFPVKLRR